MDQELQLVFADPSAVTRHDLELQRLAGLPSNAPLAPSGQASGVPILLDQRMRPIEPWCTYLRLLSQTVSSSTIRNYGYDARRFASFLNSRGTDVLSATQDDLVAYRDARLKSISRPVSPSTWHRSNVVIRGIFSYLVRTGQRDTEPWIRVGSRTVLDVRLHDEMRVRALTRDQWVAFRDVGLGGELPDGAVDDSWRGSNPMRSIAAAELALTTGMRLGEWRTLLDFELTPSVGGATVVLQACAKYQKRRRVFIPASTLEVLDLYQRTERRRVTQRASGNLARHLKDLALVKRMDSGTGKVTLQVDGQLQTMPIESIPPELRRVLVVEGEAGLQSASLFVARSGLPPGHRSWLNTFHLANQRLERFRGQVPALPPAVTPHDLRHTFAVVLLRSLMELAAEREATRPVRGRGTLSEHLAVNPLLTVQRLLGHASPSTTMVYLRHVEDTDALVQRCFESWLDEDTSYADYLTATEADAS